MIHEFDPKTRPLKNARASPAGAPAAPANCEVLPLPLRGPALALGNLPAPPALFRINSSPPFLLSLSSLFLSLSSLSSLFSPSLSLLSHLSLLFLSSLSLLSLSLSSLYIYLLSLSI